jgi:leucyl aminopeptidase
MLIMKKDMGGAAASLALAHMIMDRKLKVSLRVLIPAVENSVSGNAFRPLDIYPSRKGLTVEVGNTDAEGRLVLADALALADEEEPDLLIDMGTLTGAARVALGPDLPPFNTLRKPSAIRSGACRSGRPMTAISIPRSRT